jgi:hypothetical protein
MPDRVSADVVPNPVHAPVRAARQPLHPVRDDLAGLLGQRTAVLPLQERDQPGHITANPRPRLRAGEHATRDALHRLGDVLG